MLQALNIHTQEVPLPTLHRNPLAARSRTRTWRQATRQDRGRAPRPLHRRLVRGRPAQDRRRRRRRLRLRGSPHRPVLSPQPRRVLRDRPWTFRHIGRHRTQGRCLHPERPDGGLRRQAHRPLLARVLAGSAGPGSHGCRQDRRDAQRHRRRCGRLRPQHGHRGPARQRGLISTQLTTPALEFGGHARRCGGLATDAIKSLRNSLPRARLGISERARWLLL